MQKKTCPVVRNAKKAAKKSSAGKVPLAKDGGRWVTSDGGSKLYIAEGGDVHAGGPKGPVIVGSTLKKKKGGPSGKKTDLSPLRSNAVDKSKAAAEATDAAGSATKQNDWKILMHWGKAGSSHSASAMEKVKAGEDGKKEHLMALDVHNDTARYHNQLATTTGNISKAKRALHSAAADAHKEAANAHKEVLSKMGTFEGPTKRQEAMMSPFGGDDDMHSVDISRERKAPVKKAALPENRSKNKMSPKAQTAHANLTKKGFKRVGKAGIGKWMYENPSTGQTALLGRSSGVVKFDDEIK